jgi:hypothetical protein
MAFKKGKSGNPAGRPKGALNHTTLIVQKLLASEAEEVSRKVIEMAKDGDFQAAKLIIERVCPPIKDAPIEFKLQKIQKVEDLLKAFTRVNEGLGSGELTPDQAKAITNILEAHRKALETNDLERRIELLEESIKKGSVKRR